MNSKTPVEFLNYLIDVTDSIFWYYVKFDGSVRHGSINLYKEMVGLCTSKMKI